MEIYLGLGKARKLVAILPNKIARLTAKDDAVAADDKAIVSTEEFPG